MHKFTKGFPDLLPILLQREGNSMHCNAVPFIIVLTTENIGYVRKMPTLSQSKTTTDYVSIYYLTQF